MIGRVGYACIPLGDPALRGAKSTVLRLATPERLRALIGENIEGLLATLDYNERHGLRLFRINSDFIPFGSHPVNRLAWWEEFAAQLREVGRRARAMDHRLSFHVTQYTILNSANPEVAASARLDVEYQARVLDAFGLDTSHKVVAHAGVATPDRHTAAERLLRSLDQLSPPARARLVLENDDRVYPADEVCALCERAGVPMVMDVFHHRVCGGPWAALPLAEVMARAFATWRPADGPPKIHFSSQDPAKRPGAHAARIDGADLERFLEAAAPIERVFDIMFEAKEKDLAVRELLPLLESPQRLVPEEINV